MGARGIGHTACSLELWLSMQNLGTKFPYIYYSPNSFIKKKKKVLSQFLVIFLPVLISVGYAVAQLVEALRYKPEGRGFDSRRCYWNFSLT